MQFSLEKSQNLSRPLLPLLMMYHAHAWGKETVRVHPKGVGISNARRVRSALESAASRTDPASSDPRVERARDNIAAEGRVCERAREYASRDCERLFTNIHKD